MTQTLYDRIKQRLDALGLSERAASVAATGNDATIRMIRTGKSANPRSDTIAKLARVLEVNEQWLMTGDAPATTTADPLPPDVRDAPVSPDQLRNLPKDVPVLGTVAGSALGNGSFQLTTDVVDYVRRPFGLLTASDIYALYVEGESMVPKVEPGELVFVHPHRKARPGDYVVIQEPDVSRGEVRGFIKRLVAVTATLIKTEQFNPAGKVDFVVRPGIVVHKVMDSTDLYGV
jgi:phage repressor protein C with HTH and peptisase S24 domain